QYVMTRHGETQIAAIDIRRNQLLLDRARVEPVPDPQLQMGYQYNVGDTIHNHPLIALYAEIPLFDRNQGAIRAAENEVAAASARMSATQNTLAGQLAAALAQYHAATLVTQRYTNEILPAAREAQAAIQRGYTQGEFDLLRVLQSQRTLVDAELGYLDAQEQRWTSAATLSSLLQEEKFP
ncbi:MAG TPA: TolC family protein, partial [Pirellulales bacterium]